MTEHRMPYLTDCQPSAQEQYILKLERERALAIQALLASLALEGLWKCPCCGWTLKGESDS